MNNKFRTYCLDKIKNQNLPVTVFSQTSGDLKKKFFSEADVFLFPPREPEGHPWVIIEALAAGLPIISTNQGAIIESVQNSKNGFIVNIRQPAEIAEKIEFLKANHDIREKMGKESRHIYEQNFTEEIMINNLKIAFEKTLSQKAENATSYHSNVSISFSGNYNKLPQFKERKELFIKKTITFLPANSHILDLGCGPGVISAALAERGFKVTGIDGSSEMIRLAQSNAKLSNNILFLQKNIPFNSEGLEHQFDGVISSSVLEYLDEYDKTIILVRELLKDKGIFIASIPNRISIYRKFENLVFYLLGWPAYLKFVRNKPSLDEFTSSLSKYGFECLEFEYFATKGPIFQLISKLIPDRYIKNMLFCVFRKI